MRAAGRHFGQVLFTLACLPYEAYFEPRRDRAHDWFGCWSLIAGCSNGARRGRSIEKPIEQRRSGRAISPRPFGSCGSRQSVAVAAAICTAVINARRAARPRSPFFCCGSPLPRSPGGSSRPLRAASARLTADQLRFLRQFARRTWAFFEAFVGPDDHWLPPDNFQEHPVATVAHRTSPTNMGLALLANVTAYDFGYITAGPARRANRRNALQSMQALRAPSWPLLQLVRHAVALRRSRRATSRPVDSGNLAGHLLTLRAALAEIADAPIIGRSLFLGLGRHFAAGVANRGSHPRQPSAALTRFAERAQIRAPRPCRSRLPARTRISRSWSRSRAQPVDPAPARDAVSSEALGWVQALVRAVRGSARRVASARSLGDACLPDSPGMQRSDPRRGHSVAAPGRQPRLAAAGHCLPSS